MAIKNPRKTHKDQLTKKPGYFTQNMTVEPRVLKRVVIKIVEEKIFEWTGILLIISHLSVVYWTEGEAFYSLRFLGFPQITGLFISSSFRFCKWCYVMATLKHHCFIVLPRPNYFIDLSKNIFHCCYNIPRRWYFYVKGYKFIDQKNVIDKKLK